MTNDGIGRRSAINHNEIQAEKQSRGQNDRCGYFWQGFPILSVRESGELGQFKLT